MRSKKQTLINKLQPNTLCGKPGCYNKLYTNLFKHCVCKKHYILWCESEHKYAIIELSLVQQVENYMEEPSDNEQG